MEVFISSADYSGMGAMGRIREHLRNAVLEAWRQIDGTSRAITTQGPHERWLAAEKYCKGDIYCLADDDCLPYPGLKIADIVDLFERHQDFGVLALKNPMVPIPKGWPGEEIFEAGSVGGIRFLRRGMLKEFPDNFTGDDSQHAEMVRNAGFRSGYIKKIPMLHLGEWHSSWQYLRSHA